MAPSPSHHSQQQHWMLLPSLACQAKCAYCFGPNKGPVMRPDIFDAALDWIDQINAPGGKVEITFHGGEPLIAGRTWYECNLPLLRERFGSRLKLGIQSNLWLLDDDTCTLFKEYNVSIGTSLDGPQYLNDPQRGEGYFARTMAGITTARRNGLSIGVICTFTRRTALHCREVFDFFATQGLSFSVHEAVCSLGSNHSNGLVMPPDENANLLVGLFDYYLENITRVQIPTFDQMAKGLSAQNGAICTFGNCLGRYLTIGPRGEIYSCNRFAYHPQWQIGSVFDRPSLETLAQSEAWQKLRQRELTVHEDCGDCAHWEYCKGGCPYNAITSGTDRRDPHCLAYKRLFDHMTTQALDEVFSEENMEAVAQHGLKDGSLMRKGKLIQIMRSSAHPQEVARRARETVAAVALAVSSSPEEAVEKLDRAGIVTNREIALGSVRALRERLGSQSQKGLVNAYLHVTYACNLSCTHCYARSGPGASPTMTVEEVKRLAQEATEAGFAKIVITGGEPMSHPQRDTLLDTLRELRSSLKPAQTVMRTNLAYPLTPDLIERLAHSTDQVVVSIDGDEASHDARRGTGMYARTVANVHLLLAANPTAEIILTAVLTTDQISGAEDHAVRTLGEALGVRVRFKTVLPIGRGADLSLTPAYYNSLDDSTEALASSARPTATCGLGMNLYIGPRGECYPCYALMGARHMLGNALDDELASVLKRNDTYRNVTVDSNTQCCTCALRYLCGGFCRAWAIADDPNSPPIHCGSSYVRACDLLLSALEALNVSAERWLAARLPVPEQPLNGKHARVKTVTK